MKNIRQLLQLIIDNKDRAPQIRSESNGDRAKLYIDGVIDSWFGITAADVARALEEIGGADIDLFLNSPGGDVFEGRSIQTRLKRYSGNITVHIDGLAASAATTVALGGNKRIIADGAFWMIHNAWTLGFGDKNDFAKVQQLLAQIDDAIAKDYGVVTGEEKATIVQWMDDETWFSAQAAMDAGFVDEIFTGDDDSAAANRAAWNLAAYSNVPAALKERPAPRDQFPGREKLGRYLDMLERIG